MKQLLLIVALTLTVGLVFAQKPPKDIPPVKPANPGVIAGRNNPQKPDIFLFGLTVSYVRSTQEHGTPEDVIHVAYSMKNIGPVASDNAKCVMQVFYTYDTKTPLFHAAGGRVATELGPKLEPNKPVVGQFDVFVRKLDRTKPVHFTLVADYGNQIAELDEGNNQVTVPLKY